MIMHQGTEIGGCGCEKCSHDRDYSTDRKDIGHECGEMED